MAGREQHENGKRCDDDLREVLVARDDHQAMAAGAIRLLNDNELALKLVRTAHESSKKFTWPHIRTEWLKLYRELAEEKGEAVPEGLHHVNHV